MRKKNKKANPIKRATKIVLGHMDKIYQKHRDTRPMDEEFFEEFKEVYDIESYLKELFFDNQASKHLEKERCRSSSKTIRTSNLGMKPSAINFAMAATHIMKVAYDLHALSSDSEKEEITLNA